MFAPPVWFLWTAVGVLSSSAVVQLKKDDINLWMMGLFRDLGRHKAYKRRFGDNDNGIALMTVLMHQEEDPLLGMSLENDDESNVPTYTLSELWEFGNGIDDAPLLLSIFGRIYDVSAGEKFYGPEAPYGVLIGHDVTYALATGCKACASTEKDKTAEDLSEKQLKEGKRWLSFFQLHDKYPYVGKLDATPVEANMNEWIDADIAKQLKEETEGRGEPLKPPY
jgi:predicted heme/steroid binding protein